MPKYQTALPYNHKAVSCSTMPPTVSWFRKFRNTIIHIYIYINNQRGSLKPSCLNGNVGFPDRQDPHSVPGGTQNVPGRVHAPSWMYPAMAMQGTSLHPHLVLCPLLCRYLQHLVICPLFWAYQNPIVGICPLLWAYMPTFVGICAQIFVCTGRAYIYLMSYLKVALYIYCHTSVDIHKCDLDWQLAR